MGIGFQKPRYIGQVLLALARPAGRIEHGPDLSLKNVLKAGHRETNPEDIAHCGASQKRLIAENSTLTT